MYGILCSEGAPLGAFALLKCIGIGIGARALLIVDENIMGFASEVALRESMSTNLLSFQVRTPHR